MGRLFLFGDSFTQGHDTENQFIWYKKWYSYLGNKFPPNWFEILSYKLDYELHNLGKAGDSNYEIFESFCKNSHNIEKGDIVIIQWTYNTRFRWATDSGWFKCSSVILDNDSNFNNITKKATEEILVNRTHKLYCNEVLNYENLIEQYSLSKGFNLYFWCVDEDNIYSQSIELLSNKKYLCHNLITPIIDKLKEMGHRSVLLNLILYMGGKLISEETNGVIEDGTHLGEYGHKLQGELFYNHIKNEQV